MSKIKIKNFGPIKDGLDVNSGFIEIKKITVFIGNQATGKKVTEF
jgi:predicted ATPase